MNLFHPPPSSYDDIPTVDTLQFFFLMSPDYGETAAIQLANGQTLVVERIGRLMGVVGSGDKTGKYLVYIEIKDQSPSRDYLTTEQANSRFRELMNG